MNDKQTAIRHAELRQAASLDALANDTKAADLRMVIKIRESVIKYEIASETGEDMKPVYSNDVKRDAEFVRRSAESEKLRKYEAELSALECNAATAKIDAQFNADMIRVLVGFAEAEKQAVA